MKNKFMDSKLGKWIKRIVVILIVLGLVAFGVVKLIQNKTSNVEKSALETLEALDSYYMEASMDFYKGEDTRSYTVKISYKDNEDADLFKVSMYDKAVNQEQIIIKNKDGLYSLLNFISCLAQDGIFLNSGVDVTKYPSSSLEISQSPCIVSTID